MKKLILVVLATIFVFFTALSLSCRLGSNPKVTLKLKLIELSLKKSGYKVDWIVVSERRSWLANFILPNSSKKKSQHLTGNAIDVFVFDVDGNKRFSQADLDLVKTHNRLVEKAHPELKGAFGTYTHTLTSSRTFHIDTRGKSFEYNN
jgi:hypothetical protein